MKTYITLTALLLIALGIGAVVWYGADTAPPATLPNPASVFCEENGGTVEIVEGEGGQQGICHLPDGRTCDEWEFYQAGACNTPSTRDVTLFYYNPALDQGPGGVQCTANGLVAVTRTVQTPITVDGVVGRLLAGSLTAAEVAQGIETEFPLDGLVLVSSEQVGDTLTLTFDDPQSKTVGGSCRVAILWHQISATAKAFTGAAEVRFMPEELFQP